MKSVSVLFIVVLIHPSIHSFIVALSAPWGRMGSVGPSHLSSATSLSSTHCTLVYLIFMISVDPVSTDLNLLLLLSHSFTVSFSEATLRESAHRHHPAWARQSQSAASAVPSSFPLKIFALFLLMTLLQIRPSVASDHPFIGTSTRISSMAPYLHLTASLCSPRCTVKLHGSPWQWRSFH